MNNAMETLTLYKLLRLTLLLVVATAMPTGDLDHLSPSARSRRTPETSSSALQYMEKLRESLSDEQGKPMLANPDDPTEIWGIQDVDLLGGVYRKKVRSSERCTGRNRFFFSWQSFSESMHSETLLVERATLRAHMKVIPRLLNQNGPTLVSADVYIKSRRLNSTSLGIHAGRLQLSVTAASWVEVDISEGVRSIWPPRNDETHVEINVIFRTGKCKVPVIEDPTSIPLRQAVRRQRLSALQPMFLVYFSDELVKEVIRDETVISGEDYKFNNHIPDGDDLENGAERRKRDANDAYCSVEDFQMVFTDVGIDYVFAPYSYNARQCRGSCSHNTLTEESELANNHAKLMASALAKSEIAPHLFSRQPKGPCCVPTKYSALTLVIPQFDGIKYVVYSHMVVEECKCR